MKRSVTHKAADALPYLEQGAIFVLKAVRSKNGKIVRNYTMKLVSPQGEYIEGAWGNAKNELARMARLQPIRFEGDQAWILSK